MQSIPGIYEVIGIGKPGTSDDRGGKTSVGSQPVR
jgi:hypothetical protein